jgi:hypothetical protein
LKIVLSPILNPVVFWGKVSSKSSLKYILWIFGPVMFVPFLSWRALLCIVPTCLMYLVSQSELRLQPIYHHGIEPAFIALVSFPSALVYLVSYLKNRDLKWNWSEYLPVVWLAMVFFCFGRSELFFLRRFEDSNHTRWIRRQLLPCVQPEVSMSASGALVPHLIQRKWIHHLPHLETPVNWVGQEKVSCVVFDSEVNNWPFASEEWASFFSDLEKKDYHLAYSCEGTKIYQWNRAKDDCLQCLPSCIPVE